MRTVLGWKSLSRPPAEASQPPATIRARHHCSAILSRIRLAGRRRDTAAAGPAKTADDGDALLRRPSVAQEADDTGVDILAIDPLESTRIELELMERRLRAV